MENKERIRQQYECKAINLLIYWLFDNVNIDEVNVCHLQVEGHFYVNKNLEELMLEELRNACKGAIGGFLPAVKQIANVAALPGIVGVSQFTNSY